MIKKTVIFEEEGSKALNSHNKIDSHKQLQELHFTTYINVGMESADLETLMTLKKTMIPKGVEEAF